MNPQKGSSYYYPCACNRPIRTISGVVLPGTEQHEQILASGYWNLNDLLTPQPQKTLQLNVENGYCQHRTTQGDNYGITCMDCGEAIAGYGYWGEGSTVCKHDWARLDEESDEEMCMYCQAVRSAPPKPVAHRWQKGDLGIVNNTLVLLLEEERSVWISQRGDCGYYPTSGIKFIQRIPLPYRFVDWKQTIADYLGGKFTSYFALANL
ncbi:hypothetical protein [Fibrisoma limi]|nr:hypothetical protein [Fibrisoma limi]